MATDEEVAVQADVFGSLFLIAQHLTRRADGELAELGLTTRQWLLLAVLMKKFPGVSPTLSQAAQEYGSSRQNIKQMALGLEARGFVRLVADPADARATRIEVTERVREFDEPRMLGRTTVMLADAFSGLTPQQTRQLRDLSSRWLAALVTPTSGER